MTLDTDVAVPGKLPLGDTNMRDNLLAHGFTEESHGEHHPPATHYHLEDEDTGFYAEFLTPLIGSVLDRKQKPKVITEVAGIATQQLRHIDLLLHEPWSIDFR